MDVDGVNNGAVVGDHLALCVNDSPNHWRGEVHAAIYDKVVRNANLWD